jgi:hypothetical protein
LTHTSHYLIITYKNELQGNTTMMKKILLLGCLLSFVTPQVKAEIDMAFITKVTLVSVATGLAGVWVGRKSSNEAALKEDKIQLVLRAHRAERKVERVCNQRDDMEKRFKECERLRNRWKLVGKAGDSSFSKWMREWNTTQ